MQTVVAGTAVEHVIAVAAEHGVVAALGPDAVVAYTAVKFVGAFGAVEGVIAVRAAACACHDLTSTGHDTLLDTGGDDVYRLSTGNDRIADHGGHDTYQIGFGHLALGGTTTIQDVDGQGAITYNGHTLNADSVYAVAEGEWLSLDRQAKLTRDGGSLVVTNATPGSSGKVVFENFFSEEGFLGLTLPKFSAVTEPEPDPEPDNTAPTVGRTLTALSVDEDSGFAFTVPDDVFVDADGDSLVLSARLATGAALPAWLSFDAATRSFTGTLNRPGFRGVSIL